MDKFIRENRYIVIKLKRLTARQSAMVQKLLPSIPLACVTAAVVEKDWPEYEPTWRAIEARVTGQPVFDEAAEQAAFIEAFKLDGKIYRDSNTKQWLPTRDSIEGFQMAERTHGCWVGWLVCAKAKAGVQ